MKKLLSILIILFTVSTAVFAGEIAKTKLPSGQTVIVKEIKTNPIVIIDTWVKTGSIDETDENNGVAHFLEHLFFKGSQNYPNNEFDKILEAKGASTNAATSKDYTHFYILLPSKDFETALKLHADMLTKPLLPPAEINKERHVVIREIEKNNDNPNRVLYNKINSVLYKTHPYKREVIGTKEIIANIPREEIIKFYAENYTPDNMITVIIGDVDAKKATELVEKYFSMPLATAKAKHENYKQDKRPDTQQNINIKEDVKTSYLSIAYKCGLKVSDKDSYALDLLSVILGQGDSSRLSKIEDEKQLTQGISAGHVSMKDDSIFMVTANLSEENIDDAKKEIFSEIDKFKTEKVTPEELERAKKIMERETLYSRESVADNASEIGYSTLLTGDWNFYNDYLKNMKEVTANDIQKVAKKYLDENHAIIGTLTPKTPQPKLKKVISDKKVCEDKKINKAKLYKPAKHHQAKVLPSDKYKKYTLDNGATLIVDKHNDNEIIAISIKVKGGRYMEKTIGTDNLTAILMNKGTEKYPKNFYNKITEENGIIISPYADTEYFGLNLKCTKPDLPLALDLLNQIINKATLDQTEFEKIKKDYMYGIKQKRDNAAFVALDNLSHKIWQGTPYDSSTIVKEKNIPKICLNKVKDYYSNVFDSKNAIIAINGNVNEQEFIDYFSEVISPKNSAVVDYNNYKNLFKPISETETVTDYQGKESAWVMFAWQTDGITNKKDRATLRVINSILGSGMSSRLFTEVRAQKGLAYSVGSTTSAYVNKGMFTVFIGTDPKKVDDAEKAMFFEVERLKKEFVTDKELKDAKNKIKGEVIVSQETNAEKAHIISVSEQNGNGCDYYFDNFNRDIDNVTAEDVITVANKYFSNPYILSRVLPKK